MALKMTCGRDIFRLLAEESSKDFNQFTQYNTPCKFSLVMNLHNILKEFLSIWETELTLWNEGSHLLGRKPRRPLKIR